MKRALKLLTAICLLTSISITTLAGNADRSGEAGAYELVINPWARSSGWFNMNTASVRGIEAMKLNVAGLSFTEGTEVSFSQTLWLRGSGISISALGISQSLGDAGVIGLSMMSVNFGEVEITTTSNPEGGLGTYRPQFLNMTFGYGKTFSNSIHAGFAMTMISERIADVSAIGVAVDAGIQYVTGPKENVHFGVAIRNIGTPMRFGGSGLSFRDDAPEGDYVISVNSKAENFELPSQLNIGLSYDWWLDGALDNPNHKLTLGGTFTANSFGKDYIGAGAEYSFKNMFMIRAGYRYEQDIMNAETKTTAYSGIAAGVSVDVPLRKDDPDASRFAIDYSYKPSNPYNGTHAIGARFLF